MKVSDARKITVMSSRHELLAKLNKLVEEHSQDGGSHSSKEKIQSWKKMLIDALNHFQSNERSEGGSSDAEEVTLAFIKRTLSQCPEVFIQPPPESPSDDTPGLSQVAPGVETTHQRKEEEYDFLCWTMAYLLPLLMSTLDSGRLSEQAQALAAGLLAKVGRYDVYAFHGLCAELVMALAELVEIGISLKTEQTWNQHPELKRFVVDSAVQIGSDGDKVKLPHYPIVLKEWEASERLQVGIVRVLQAVCMGLVQFGLPGLRLPGNGDPGVLWATLAYHLESGGILLKTVSLQLCARLLEYDGLPTGQSLHYFLDCVSAMLKFLASRGDEWDGDLAKLEMALADCMCRLLTALTQPTVSHVQHTAVQNLTIEGIIAVITTHGARNLRTSCLRNTVCDLLTDLWQQIQGHRTRNQVMTQKRLDMCLVLIGEVGITKDCQYVVNILRAAVELELPPAQAKSLAESDSESSEEELPAKRKRTQLAISPKWKSRSANYGACLAQLEKSRLLQALRQKAKTLIEKLSQLSKEEGQWPSCEMICQLYEGIRVVMEVLAGSVLGVVDRLTHLEGSQPIGAQSGSRSESHVQGQMEVWADLTHSLCAMWKSQLLTCVTDANHREMLGAAFGSLVKSIGALVFVHDVLKLPANVLECFVWILSLPWLSNDMSWMDLRPPDSKDIAGISDCMADSVGEEAVAVCVEVLAQLPKDAAGKWRTRALQIAATDTREKVRCSVIASFPLFLYHSGPNANHLVRDILHAALKDQCQNVQICLASTVGRLACVVSRKAVLHRAVNKGTPTYRSTHVQCASCDHAAVAKSQESKDRPKIVDPNMFLPFLDPLSKPKNSPVKMAFLGSTERLFGHIGLRSNNAATCKMLEHCLALMTDGDYHIRLKFSEQIHLIVRDGCLEPGAVEELVLVKLKVADKATKMASPASAGQLSETILMTVGRLAQVIVEGKTQVLPIIILLSALCEPCCPLAAAVAFGQLKDVAKVRKMSMRSFFMCFSRKLCKVLVDYLHDAQRRGREPLAILHEVAVVFEFDNVKTFLSKTEKHLLPHLVKKATNHASVILKLIASQQGDPNHKGPLVRNVRFIFCHLVMSFTPSQNDELMKTFRYLEAMTEWNMCSILKYDPNVDSELLLHLRGSHFNLVLRGLKIWASQTGIFTGSPEDITDEKMADLLQPKLLCSLIYFENHLRDGMVPVEEKKTAYDSLIALMTLLGPKHITTARVRLMTTIKFGEKFSDEGFPEMMCRAWNCFVRSVEMSALGPMLSQVVVNLLPLLNSYRKQITDILTYLVVDNSKNLEQHFHELYFLPEIPELADVNAVLKSYVHHSSQSPKDVKTSIEHLLKGIAHESPDVRQLAVTKLRDLLHSKQEALSYLIQGSETVDPIVGQMVTALLSGCRETDTNLRSLYGVCLGELGAIDPGRLELMQNRPKEDLNLFQSSVTEDSFAIGLINELAKAFLRTTDNNKTQDLVAYAIQMLIRIYGISPDGDPRGSGTKLWGRFSEEVQEIMAPLVKSRYIYQGGQLDRSKYQRPFYRSKRCPEYESWVSTLADYLGSKIQQDKAKDVFECCCGVIRNDSQVALYMLPYAVVHVLQSEKEEEQEELVQEILAVLDHVREPRTRHGSASDHRHLSAQTVFSVLDHLAKWMRHRVLVLTAMAGTRKSTSSSPAEPTYLEDPAYKRISGFLARIPQDVLAHASYNCSAYTRALMHYEAHVKGQKEDKQMEEHLDLLQKLYVELDEPDGMAGISAVKRTPPTLREQILAYESIGQLSDASVCYDKAIQQEPGEIGHRTGLLRCQLVLGQLSSALSLANSMIAERPSWRGQLNSFRVEATWQLGQWDKLEHCLRTEEGGRQWSIGLGKLLLAVKHRAEKDFMAQLQIVRNNLMGPLSAASMEVGSYHRGYEYILRLHMLSELEKGAEVLLNFPKSPMGDLPIKDQCDSVDRLMEQWESRLQFTQSSYRSMEPILNLRRTLLTLAKQDRQFEMDQEIRQCWLQTARVARECGLIQTAQSSLLSASTCMLPEFSLEKATWLWNKGDQDKAQWYLEKSIEEHYPNRTRFHASSGHSGVTKAERLMCAKVLLQLARYSEENASCESNAIMKQYKEVIKVHGEWEDGYFYIAKYYDKVMSQLVDSDRLEKRGAFIVQVMQYLSQSLLYGSQYIYQSMPRMLSLWLDYGTEVSALERETKRSGSETETKRSDTALQTCRAALTTLNKNMASNCQRLAPYQFLTVFPQLISRICHAHADVFLQLKEIVAKLLVTFPHQAMWMLMAVSKSSYQMRVKRCQEIFTRAISINEDMKKFLQDATKLTDRLLELCNKKVDIGVVTLSIAQNFKTLQRMISDQKFSAILIPLQDLMTPTLPSGTVSPLAHDPFAGNQVFIQGIEDTVEVLPSLQRPKKITLRGSNGQLYIMLCKPKDDLRKDARLMEFNGIINKCLRKDPESRRRGHHIRTYTVTPLNEECGLLEWVSNTSGLRHILNKLYREKNIYMTGRELKSYALPASAPPAKKMEYYKKLLARHPAVFSEWFLRSFPDPTSWYNARLAYCRTTAVMSIVGYILGLGDRHGENILLDSTNGDCLHVDFNCLFNKGETFDVPEIVPFRLTHNMVEAMGLMAYEGVFRRACEVTLRVMRDQTDPLMSVLKTFIYDPLVEWSKPSRSRSNPTETGEIRNEKAQTHVNNIEARLRGVLMKKSRGLPLSVEGHVSHLIKEATDDANLSAMYIGWAPYL